MGKVLKNVKIRSNKTRTVVDLEDLIDYFSNLRENSEKDTKKYRKAEIIDKINDILFDLRVK